MYDEKGRFTGLKVDIFHLNKNGQIDSHGFSYLHNREKISEIEEEHNPKLEDKETDMERAFYLADVLDDVFETNLGNSEDDLALKRNYLNYALRETHPMINGVAVDLVLERIERYEKEIDA